MRTVRDNLLRINENIAEAAIRSGREPQDVKLICVSKTVGEAEVREAIAAGQRDFAENRVQKLVEKQTLLADVSDIVSWHLIGQLQTNKIKYCAGRVALIHSIDRLGLLEELNRYAARKDIAVEGLLELNLSGEENKTGMRADALESFLEALPDNPRVTVRGLMTMAPEGAEEKVLRDVFGRCAELAARIKDMKIPNAPMGELSMGMSGDYEAAVLEGATMVRIGTAVFRTE
ncbi:MAG: YggS family pyridoxal phosphate-dependent enzyme [Clostridia bacterium]|nr:YggS family pyridoxal phosphate-dependent enzyme [Clostridia bacterium]